MRRPPTAQRRRPAAGRCTHARSLVRTPCSEPAPQADEQARATAGHPGAPATAAPSRRRRALSKKKKVRVAFKKNRQKRTRANDLTRAYESTDQQPRETALSERVRAKGDLSRHRTIVTDVDQDAPGKPVDESSGAAAARRTVD